MERLPTPWGASRLQAPFPMEPWLPCGKTPTPGTCPMSTPEPFVYRLKALAKVVDGDTLDLDLDLGFSLVLRQRVRLLSGDIEN